MRPGDVIDGRFSIERLAQSGGMGSVYKARDNTTGQPIALKVQHSLEPEDDARFCREAEVLAALDHPHVVRHVKHGVTAPGERYLAMEWLDGEDLAMRLKRGPLSVSEAVACVLHVAEALGAAHAQGIVHRDVKPSNLFLVDGDPSRVKILDFGVARVLDPARAVTRTGGVVGTLAYMAPEQARGERDAGARVDVFALGCVLFECLTGRAPVEGRHALAVLAKILVEEAPRVEELRHGVPAALSDLVARMLAKQAAERPLDGRAVAEELSAILGGEGDEAFPPDRPSALGAGERRLVCVILVAPPGGAADTSSDTITPAQADAVFAKLRAAVLPFGAELEGLADGTAIVTLVSDGAATDQAARAARTALALGEIAKASTIALATGAAELRGRLPMGEAIDRAVSLLRAVQRSGLAPRGPLIDEVTAGLCAVRFEMIAESAARVLVSERERYTEGPRTLLGKPTECVGRDRELAMLTATLDECIDDQVARVVLVTAPAGAGKSRLRAEFLRAHEGKAKVWIARGDPMSAGAPFGMIAQLVRRAAGLADGAPIVEQRRGLATYATSINAGNAMRTAAYLGELAGVPFDDGANNHLGAARMDAKLMGDHMRAAFCDLLAGENKSAPLVLALEDLHWGDLPSVQFLDAALRSLADRSIFLLALARPEVHDLFPRLWSARGVHEIRLGELPKRAAERLVRSALGEDTPRAILDRIVAQAEGNAFYLEELIRAVAEGKGEALPGTVLAMVQARLASLPAETRRVLRAGSVFGQVFWKGGIAALLGEAPEGRAMRTSSPDALLDLDGHLRDLAARELVIRKARSKFLGDDEYTFRHALLREGAYATLTDDDRALGHMLAGAFLERSGEPNAMVLAEHFERGGDAGRAGTFFVSAAAQALRGGDTDAALARATRGLAGAVPDHVRVPLLGVLTEAHGWRGEWPKAAAYAAQVMELSPPGSAPWVLSSTVMLAGHAQRGDDASFLASLSALSRVTPEPGAEAAIAMALATASFLLESTGRFALSGDLVRRIHEIVTKGADRDPIARAWMSIAHTHREACAGCDPWSGLAWADAARGAFSEAGHRRGVLFADVMIGMNAWMLGALERAESALRATLVVDEELGLLSSNRTFYFLSVLAETGNLDEGVREAERMIDAGKARGFVLEEARGHWALAELLRRTSDRAGARAAIHEAIAKLGAAPIDHAAAHATLAAILLADGDASGAADAADHAILALSALGAPGFRGTFARVARAEALAALGRPDEARSALREAHDHAQAIAAKIPDAAVRAGFWSKVPENATLLALMERWGSP